ncbi:formate dehydrogenase subunit delta [Roseateles sp. BYS180W]|uniref:Formate dehydrogenase subunit delta n=1 Tax=Roseateles rivi TaxID=3299028 RepID=A0ABW7FXU7_9BURK
MDTDNLIRMANRIADFFAAMPDPEEASSGVAQHISRFWEPRMRRQLLDEARKGSAQGLHPLVQQALAKLSTP